MREAGRAGNFDHVSGCNDGLPHGMMRLPDRPLMTRKLLP
jgi:hypothetical protein